MVIKIQKIISNIKLMDQEEYFPREVGKIKVKKDINKIINSLNILKSKYLINKKIFKKMKVKKKKIVI